MYVIQNKIPFEMPGGSSGKAKKETRAQWAEKALGTVPTAHTCDNVLEMPNYWSLLMRAEGLEWATASSRSVAATNMPQEKVCREGWRVAASTQEWLFRAQESSAFALGK